MKVRLLFLISSLFLLSCFKGAGQMTLSFTTTDVSCNGGSDGSVTVHVTGGIPPYTYTWSTGDKFTKVDTFCVLSGQPADSYWVVVDDSGASSVFDTSSISQPTALIIDTQSSTDISCNGTNDGTITISASGGIPPYDYSINGGSTFLANGGNFSGLAGGNYPVVIRDSNGCITTGSSETITDPPGISFISQTKTDITCNGLTDGTISIVVSGGTSPYEYSINGGATFQNNGGMYSGLSAGNYDIAVRDVNGCTSFGTTLNIAEPSLLVIDTQNKTDVSCNTGADGTITITASGGIPNYQYSVDAGLTWFSNGGLFSGLTAGNYDIAVKDLNGCITNGSTLVILQPSALSFDSQTSTDVSCNGGSDGTLSLSVSGATPPYQYSLDGGVTYFTNGGIFTGLPAANYDMAVKDKNGCVYLGATLGISEPGLLVIDSQTSTNLTCFGANDGTLSIAASGGTPPYEYSIDGGTTFVTNGGNFIGLDVGNYDVVVRDNNLCQAIGATITISEPSAISITSEVATDISCNGASDGKIVITAAGGTPAFTYSIDGGTTYAALGTFTGLPPGNYDVMVMDQNGCTKAGSTLVVNQPPVLKVDSETVIDNLCFGGVSGSINISASGGISPYTFSNDGGTSWLNNGGTFTGLAAGNYSMAVRDQNGCIVTGSILTVGEPGELIIDTTLVTEITCNGYADGSLQITAHGGTPNYQYSIDSAVTFLNNGGIFVGLTPGKYKVAVQDINGCIKMGGNFLLSDPPSIIIDSENTTNISCNSLSDGMIILTASGGMAPYQYSIDNGVTYSGVGNFTGLSTGSYQIVIKDAKGCIQNGSDLNISEPPPLQIDSEQAFDLLCNGGSDGHIDITSSGGTSPYSYSTDGGLTYFDNGGFFTGLSTGSYSIAVKDQNGCIKSGSTLTISEPMPLTMAIDTTKASCNKFTADGSIQITPGGGVPGYSFSIDGGTTWQNKPLFSNLLAGNYAVVLRDTNLCTLNNLLNLESKNSVVVDAGKDTSICPGDQVVLQGSGGPTYLWSPASSLNDPNIYNPVASPTLTTQYALTITKGACSNVDSVTVVVYELPKINAGKDTSIFRGSSMLLNATGGVFATYFWSPETGLSGTSGASVTTTPADNITYTVIGTTADGCISSDSISLTVFRNITIPSGFTPNQDGYNDTWVIEKAWLLPNIVVEVVNRWGQRVFYSKGYGSGQEWDGTRNGKDLPIGTYYFVIILNDGRGSPPITGPVTIVR